MNDEVARILSEFQSGRVVSPDLDPDVDISEEDFDEAGYLRLNPDVAEAVRRGYVQSGYLHYIGYGYREGRSVPGSLLEPRNRLILTKARSSQAEAAGERPVPFSVDRIIVSPGGGLMIIGWINDLDDPVLTLRVSTRDWRINLDGAKFARIRRMDVEEALGAAAAHPFGFFGFFHVQGNLRGATLCEVQATLGSGAMARVELAPGTMDDVELRNLSLAYLAHAQFFGSPHVEALLCLEGGLGDQFVGFNRQITQELVRNPYVESFGASGRAPKASLIVCLYGKAEFQFIQSCLYARLPGIEDYEFVFVSNSPELGEGLLREAKTSTRVYGIPQTIVVLPGNAGFGAANNAAVQAARSSRVIALNPDVFPRDPEWARKHLDLIEALPEQQTQIFGAPLYYDDGTLMHGGMYFEMDHGLSMKDKRPHSIEMVRVEHYGKGEPVWSEALLRPRPVPAVTGAFISANRHWFEQLGGFTEDYIFGHYEDADLCLKSLAAGTPSWLHDLRMWHLEGKGSTRLPPHEGGSLVNRWLFSKVWGSRVKNGLLGKEVDLAAVARSVRGAPAAPASVRAAPGAGISAATEIVASTPISSVPGEARSGSSPLQNRPRLKK